MTVNKTFDYAYQAFDLKVYDYLLKPLNPIKLRTTLTAIIEELNSYTLQEEYLKKLESKVEKKQEEKYLIGALLGDEIVASKINFEDKKNIAYVQLAKFEIKNELKNKAFLILQKYIEDQLITNVVAFHDLFNDIIILRYSSNGTVNNSIFTFCREFSLQLRKSLLYDGTFFVSNLYNNILDMQKCYQELLEIQFFNSDQTRNEKFISRADFSTNDFIDNILSKEKIQIIKALRKKDFKNIKKIISRIYSSISDRDIYYLNIQLFFLGTHFLREQNIEICNVMTKGEKTAELLEYPLKKEQSYLEIMSTFYLELIKVTEKNKPKIEENIGKSCKRYVLKNFNDPQLTVKKISDDLFINTNYLSSLFRKRFGMTLKQYINDIRIDAAKKLINQTSYSLSTIASLCGFNDALYFSKRFKKMVGCTPSEYKKESLKVK